MIPWPIFGRALRSLGMGGGRAGGGVLYLLQDLFTTARSAGSVNATAAEPTGQTRTVTDGNNVLSITGGKISFATGGVGQGNPGLWYSSIITVGGMMLIGQITQTASGTGSIGWDTDQTALINDCIRIPSGTIISVIANSVAISVGVSTAGITYTICIIQRPNGGFYFFIKGGTEYAFWILLWISLVGATGSHFPAVGAQSGTVAVFTSDNIRVPVSLYVPAPLAYDTFTRANGALGSTETTSPDGVAIAALTWLFTVGVWAVNGNKAVATPNLGADAIVNGGFGADANWNKGAGWTIAAGVAAAAAASSDLSQTIPPLTVGLWYQVTYTITGFSLGTAQAVVGTKALPTHGANGTFTEIARADTTAFAIRGAAYTGSIDNVSANVLTTANLFATVLCSSADVIIDKAITLVSATGGIPDGIVVNLDSSITPQNFIIAYLDGNGNCVLEECVAGVFATKITAAVTYSAGAVLRVVRSGTECRVFYNNAAVSTVQTMTVNVNKNHGQFAVSALNSGDNVTIWARGTGNEYGGLDDF